MNILSIPTNYGLHKPITGGQNRFSNLIKSLKIKGNNIIILESKNVMDSNDTKIAKIYLYRDYKFFNRGLTIFRDINICFILEIFKILKNEKIDLIQITHPSGILVTKVMTKVLQKRIPIVYDAHNVEFNREKETFTNNSTYSKLERFIINNYIGILEKLVCIYIADHITSVSDNDKEIFIRSHKLSEQKVTVIPSGCYIHKLPDKEYKINARNKIGIDSDRVIIFFHGSLPYAPNKNAFETIENYIAPKFEEINKSVLFLVGGTGVSKFKRANIISLGFFEDLYNVMSTVNIAIVPLTKGAGTKLKVLDYLSAGLPIVTTKKGIEGIKSKNYEDSIIVDNVDEGFIDAIKYLIEDEQERKRIGENARKLAEEEYYWEKIGEKLDKLFQKISGKCNADK